MSKRLGSHLEATGAASLRPQSSSALQKALLPALRAARTAATTAAATAATGALLCLVHLQHSPLDIVAIQGLHGTSRIRARHFNEAEPTGPAGIAIVDQRNRLDRTVLFEQSTHRGLVH